MARAVRTGPPRADPVPPSASAPRFFRTPDELRRWFEENGTTATEVWIAYYKRGTGRGGVTYPEAVEEALCFGWIDGQVRSLDALSYCNRFTPRRPHSIWSQQNVRRVRELERLGRMRPPGRRAFRARSPERTGIYSFEQGPRAEPALDAAARARFRADAAASRFFEGQPPGYRRQMIEWIMLARRPETRSRRLDAVLRMSAAGRRVDPLHPYAAPDTSIAPTTTRSRERAGARVK